MSISGGIRRLFSLQHFRSNHDFRINTAGLHLILGIPGATVDPDTRSVIQKVQPGGFILFGRNIKSPQQLRSLIDDLRSMVPHEPIVCIDQEGGRVSRIKEIGSEPPSAKQLRDKGDLDLIRRHGSLTGRLLRLFGFNLDLCPVLDLSFDDEADNSLKNRTYGKTPEETILKAGVFNDAMRAEGVMSCGKHFPGYSAAGVDPHHELPEIHRTRKQLEDCEWKIFKALLPRVDTLMVAHASYRDLDPTGLSSSLSEPMVRGILRREWGYTGCVMTDDIDMGAIVHQYSLKETLHRAIQAGNDLILLCHRTPLAVEAAEILAQLPEMIRSPAINRIREMQSRLVKPDSFSLEAFQSIDREIYQHREATLGEKAAAIRSADDGKRSPVEIY